MKGYRGGTKKSRPNSFGNYKYRLISYMIKVTVNKYKHSHDKATNTLLRKQQLIM